MSILSDCSNHDILDTFPHLTNLGGSSSGEDLELVGDTLAEVIENTPQDFNLPIKLQTISELKHLFACSDADNECVRSGFAYYS